MNKFLLILVSLMVFGCSNPHYKNPHIIIYTNFGDIEVELFPDKAPKTVTAFLSYVDAGYYNNCSFYRVILTEGMSDVNYGLIQGGIWQTNDRQYPSIPGITHESTKQTGLSHTNGTISLAMTTPGTANTEFFICIGDQSQLDFGNSGTPGGQGFAAFGSVFKGMDVVRKIQLQKSSGEHFIEKIIIKKIKKL